MRSGQYFGSFDRLATRTRLATDADNVFAWAEKTYPSVLRPTGLTTRNITGYRYRGYFNGQRFLAVTNGVILGLFYLALLGNFATPYRGSVSGWLIRASTP